MDNPLGQFEEPFGSVELPAYTSLDSYLDHILPQVREFSEDLREAKFYSAPGGKPWLEIRDEPEFQETVLHFFNDSNEYLQSVDGNVTKGRWRLLDTTNKIIIEQGGDRDKPAKSELYELAFLNTSFFILQKHGVAGKQGKRKYLFMGYEGHMRGLKWKDCVEELFNLKRSHWGSFQTLLVIAVILVIIVVLFSVL